MDTAWIRDETTRLLRDLIRIDTSISSAREAPAARLLAQYLGSHGLQCDLIAKDPERPNLVARIPGSGGAPSLALLGHTDVVPADGVGWVHPPFAAHLDQDGYVWGRGAVDMKNQTATRAVTMAILAETGFAPRGDLLFIAQADEEDGVADVGMRWLVRSQPQLRTDYALDEGAGERIVLGDGRVFVTIEVGQKAILAVRVTALGEAGHASTPDPDTSAVVRLAAIIDRIARYQPRRRLTDGTRSMLEALVGYRPGDDLDQAITRVADLNPALGRRIAALCSTTMAPTRLSGSDALNVIPARAFVDVDCRLLPGATSEDLERELHEAIGDDMSYQLEFLDQLTGGATTPPTGAVVDACQDFLDHDDPGALLLPVMEAGFSDAHYLRHAWGTRAYGFWPYRTTPAAVYEAGFHSPNERIHQDDLVYAVRAHLHVARIVVG